MDPDLFRSSPAGNLIWAKGNYFAFVPNPLPPKFEWTDALVSSLDGAGRALGELAGLGCNLPNPYLLIRPFIRREAVLSSKIEGTQASLSDLYAYEAVQLELFESPSDVREVHNHVVALEHGLDALQRLPVSTRLICEIHARLLEGVRGEHQAPGEFRRTQNWIGPNGVTLNDATFVPPPVPEMLEAFAALERFIHSQSTLPPLIRLGLIHYQFETIHPFPDGNGRIGRLLMVLLSCSWRLLPAPLLYLSAFFDSNRQAYYDLLLGVSSSGAWEDWLVFFLNAVATQSTDAVVRSKRILNLRERYRAMVQSGQPGRILQVVDLLFSRPFLTVRHVETELPVDPATANRYVKRLEELGLIREITGRARDRVFRADEVMRAIDDPVDETTSCQPGLAAG